MTAVATDPTALSPVYQMPMILNDAIQGRNLIPGNVAGDDGSPRTELRAENAARSADMNQTPRHSIADLNAADRSVLAGRHIHLHSGVWVKFCPNRECDAYVFTYGCPAHVHVMSEHELAAH